MGCTDAHLGDDIHRIPRYSGSWSRFTIHKQLIEQPHIQFRNRSTRIWRWNPKRHRCRKEIPFVLSVYFSKRANNRASDFGWIVFGTCGVSMPWYCGSRWTSSYSTCLYNISKISRRTTTITRKFRSNKRYCSCSQGSRYTHFSTKARYCTK